MDYKPTQRDRDAAAAFSATVVGCSMSEPQIADCIAGKQDDTLIVQSYARHAAAERAIGYRMGIEAAANRAKDWGWQSRDAIRAISDNAEAIARGE